MPKTAYGYCRVSTDKQGEQGVEAQKQIVTDLWEKHLKKDFPTLTFMVDEDVSARQHEFNKRPKGKELCMRIQPGDALILPKLDRGFRNLRDLLNQMHLWESLKVRVVCPDFGLSKMGIPIYDSENQICRLGMIFWGIGAEIEGQRASQRMHDFANMCRRQGRAFGYAPYGFKIVRRGEPTGSANLPPAWLQPNDEEQEVMRFIYYWKRRGFGMYRIAKHLKAHGVVSRKGTPFSPLMLRKHYLSWEKIVAAEKALKASRGFGLRPDEFITPSLVIAKRFEERKRAESRDLPPDDHEQGDPAAAA